MYKGQKASKDGIQYFLCPFTDMYITQGTGGDYSHKGTMAIDVRGKEPSVRYPYYAPCDVRLIWRDLSTGEGMWQSLEKVRFSNGNIDYATFVTVHDNTFDAVIGQIIEQGNQLGNMGDKGNATGVHCHIEIAQHKFDLSQWRKNQYGNWCFIDETSPDDCFYMNDTNIMYGDGNWKYIPAETHYIGYKGHVEQDGWQDWKFDGETAGTTHQGKRLEAIQIDSKTDTYAKAHLEDIGWVDYGKIDINTVIGTTGESRRLECLCLKGDFQYRVHIQDSGWSCWTKADGVCTLGSVGESLRIEAIEMKKI
jgi:uncharacterized protein YjdB